MKFLIITNYLPHVSNFRGKLLETISNLKYEVHILAPDLDSYPNESKHLTSLGYHLHSIPLQRTGTNPVIDITTLIYTYKLLIKIKPDAILSYTIKPVIYGILAAWLARVPKRFVLLSGLGYAFQNSDEKGTTTKLQRIVYALYKQSLSKATATFFQNPDDLKLFKQLNLINSKSHTVVINGSGVDVSEFNVVDFPKDTEGKIKPSFLLVARLLKDKGIVEYIEAAKLIKQKYPQAEFHLVGWIDENPAAINQSQLDNWIASNVIQYWGKLEDVRPAIAESSVYVLPSYREGIPRSVLEAMSMGRAIITTDAPGCRETVNEGENGFLVPVKDSQKLAEAMLKFIKNPVLYRNMGDASRKIAESKYDVHKVNTHMISEMEL